METILLYYIPDHKTPELSVLAKLSQNLRAINLYIRLSFSRTFLFREKMFHCQQSGVSCPRIMSSGSSHRPLLACSGGHGGGLSQPPCWAKHGQHWRCTWQHWFLQAQSKSDFPLQQGLENRVEGGKGQHPQRSCQGGAHLALLLADMENGLPWHAP